MDADRFDRLSCALSQCLTRRTLTSLLGGLALGNSLLSHQDVAQAKKGGSKKKKSCPPCKKRKNGKCKGTQPDGTGCTDGTGQAGTCQSGSCVATVAPPPPRCAEGERVCQGRCIGPEQCCPTDDYCANGTPTCGGGYQCLRANEGGSGCGTETGDCTACTTNQQCVDIYGEGVFCAKNTGGVCQCPTAQPGFCALPKPLGP